MSDSPRWHFSKVDAISVGWFIFHSMVGALVSTLLVVVNKTDFGAFAVPVAIIVGTFSKTIQKWTQGGPCGEVVVQKSEVQIPTVDAVPTVEGMSSAI